MVIDLTSVAGTSLNVTGQTSVWIGFQFTSDDVNLGVDYEGAYIDNVSLNTSMLIPVITSVSPSTVSAGMHSTITITGTGFGAAQGTLGQAYVYTLNGARLSAPVVSWSDTSVVAEVPASSMGGPDGPVVGRVGVTNSRGVFTHTQNVVFGISSSYQGARWAGSSATFRESELNARSLTGGRSSTRRPPRGMPPRHSPPLTAGQPLPRAWSRMATTTSSGPALETRECSLPPCRRSPRPPSPSTTSASTTSTTGVMGNDWHLSDVYDVQSAALHEFGHFLGLGDVDGFGVMAVYNNPIRVTRTLGAGEAAGAGLDLRTGAAPGHKQYQSPQRFDGGRDDGRDHRPELPLGLGVAYRRHIRRRQCRRLPCGFRHADNSRDSASLCSALTRVIGPGSGRA